MLPIFFRLFFIHLKLEIVTQFPAPNGKKYYFYEQICLHNVTMRFTFNILAFRVKFIGLKFA